MAYRTNACQKGGGGSVLNAYIYVGAFALLLSGFLLLFASGEPLLVLRHRDVLFGVSNRTVLVLAGTGHLAVSTCVFVARSANMRVAVLLWLALNHLVYRLGLGWMEVREPPVLRAVSLRLGIRPETLDAGWKWFIGYLIVGSAVVLLLEWRGRKRQKAEAFMEEYRRRRLHGV